MGCTVCMRVGRGVDGGSKKRAHGGGGKGAALNKLTPRCRSQRQRPTPRTLHRCCLRRSSPSQAARSHPRSPARAAVSTYAGKKMTPKTVHVGRACIATPQVSQEPTVPTGWRLIAQYVCRAVPHTSTGAFRWGCICTWATSATQGVNCALRPSDQPPHRVCVEGEVPGPWVREGADHIVHGLLMPLCGCTQPLNLFVVVGVLHLLCKLQRREGGGT